MTPYTAFAIVLSGFVIIAACVVLVEWIGRWLDKRRIARRRVKARIERVINRGLRRMHEDRQLDYTITAAMDSIATEQMLGEVRKGIEEHNRAKVRRRMRLIDCQPLDYAQRDYAARRDRANEESGT